MRKWLQSLAPIAIAVDFGCGTGKQGKLIRSVSEDVHLTGIDSWSPTIEKHRTAGTYDRLIEGDMVEVARLLGEEGTQDLWMFGDVLEHIPQSQAEELLTSIGSPSFIVVRIPVGPSPQRGGVNPAEEHLWTFYPSMLGRLGLDVVSAAVIRHSSASTVHFDADEREEYRETKSWKGNFLLRRKQPLKGT